MIASFLDRYPNKTTPQKLCGGLIFIFFDRRFTKKRSQTIREKERKKKEREKNFNFPGQ